MISFKNSVALRVGIASKLLLGREGVLDGVGGKMREVGS